MNDEPLTDFRSEFTKLAEAFERIAGGVRNNRDDTTTGESFDWMSIDSRSELFYRVDRYRLEFRSQLGYARKNVAVYQTGPQRRPTDRRLAQGSQKTWHARRDARRLDDRIRP